MKKLMYLAITFFTFIFSFIAPIKNNFNININNNKIVEKLEPKRAIEDAPEKETSLPGLNKSFKLFLNISTIQELKEFHNELNENYNLSSNPEAISTIVILEANTILEEQDFTLNIVLYCYFINNTIKFTTSMIQQNEAVQEVYVTEYNVVNESLVVKDVFANSTTTIVNDNQVQIFVASFNDVFDDIEVPFKSINEKNSLINFQVSDVGLNSNYLYGYDVETSSAVPGLIDTISSIATGLLSLLISLFSSVVAIFWNVSNNTPTFLGVVILFVVAVPITYWVINFVIGIIRKIRLTRGK